MLVLAVVAYSKAYSALTMPKNTSNPVPLPFENYQAFNHMGTRVYQVSKFTKFSSVSSQRVSPLSRQVEPSIVPSIEHRSQFRAGSIRLSWLCHYIRHILKFLRHRFRCHCFRCHFRRHDCKGTRTFTIGIELYLENALISYSTLLFIGFRSPSLRKGDKIVVRSKNVSHGTCLKPLTRL